MGRHPRRSLARPRNRLYRQQVFTPEGREPAAALALRDRPWPLCDRDAELDAIAAAFAESMTHAERAGLVSIDALDGSCSFIHPVVARCVDEALGLAVTFEASPTPDSGLDARIAKLGLTARQAEVLRLVAQGRSNKQVAAELRVSPSTVKRHLENAYDRTGARSRSALIARLLDGERSSSDPS